MPAEHLIHTPEGLQSPFLRSIALHIGLLSALAAVATLPQHNRFEWGTADGLRFGSVTVTALGSISLASQNSHPSPVAVDTQSQVPQAPAGEQAPVAPASDAVPLNGRSANPSSTDSARRSRKPWAGDQHVAPNQLTSTVGQAVGSPLYQIAPVSIASPFGTRFGSYATVLRDRISRAWRTTDLNAQAASVVVQFTLQRNGALAPGLPRIVRSSGDANLDRSAQRAVLDAAPFQPLPSEFERNEAVIELSFAFRQ